MPQHPDHPTEQDYLDGTGRRLEYQTEKEKYKIVPCTFGGCDVDLLVNVFYAPAKAKCSAHGGQKQKAIVASQLTFTGGTENVRQNGALAKLLCPLCELPMTVAAISEAGWVTFLCTDPTGTKMEDVGKRVYCMSSVTVRPRWGAMEITNIPEAWKPFIEQFNLNARVEYFDKIECRFPGTVK